MHIEEMEQNEELLDLDELLLKNQNDTHEYPSSRDHKNMPLS